jgi:hypothetical protein
MKTCPFLCTPSMISLSLSVDKTCDYKAITMHMCPKTQKLSEERYLYSLKLEIILFQLNYSFQLNV